MKHTVKELQQKQFLPLKMKISMTEELISDWVREFGKDGVFVSFSGGKDSTVLLDIARNLYPDIKGVFFDTGLEYPEIRNFVEQFENIDWVRPEMTFKQVVDTYGYPFISKETADVVWRAKRYLDKIPTGNCNSAELQKLTELITSGKVPEIIKNKRSISEAIENVAVQKMLGIFKSDGLSTIDTLPESKEETSIYSYGKYSFLLDAPFEISATCCKVMKKTPSHKYTAKTGRYPITAQTAAESMLRTSQWLKNGCNGFHMKSPVSNPMMFWTEQDILLYIAMKGISIASVYGDVVVEGFNEIEEDSDELWLFDPYRPTFKTTLCDRTGCMFCGFGCHLEDSPGRFARLKETHPSVYDYIMKPTGLNYKEMIDWMNENGGLNIEY